MTLQTRAVVARRRRELIVSPFFQRPRIARVLVHRVTREARERPLRIGRLPETRRVDEAVVFAAGRAHHAVGPERVAHECRIVGEQRFHRSRFEIHRRLHDEACRGQIVAGTVGQPEAVRAPLARGVREFPERVALTADLRRSARVESIGTDDRRIGAAGEVQPVAAERPCVGACVIAARPVARLARDAEFCRRRVGDLIGNRPRSERRVEARPPVGRVARDADAVPRARLSMRRSRRPHHRGAPRNPAAIRGQPDRRQLSEHAAVPGRVPVDLLVVRPGRHHHAPPDTRDTGFDPASGTDPIRIVEFRPQLLTADLEAHELADHIADADVVEARSDGFR